MLGQQQEGATPPTGTVTIHESDDPRPGGVTIATTTATEAAGQQQRSMAEEGVPPKPTAIIERDGTFPAVKAPLPSSPAEPEPEPEPEPETMGSLHRSALLLPAAEEGGEPHQQTSSATSPSVAGGEQRRGGYSANNVAFVFLKPHAATHAATALAK